MPPEFWKLLSDNLVYVYLLLFFGGGSILATIVKLFTILQEHMTARKKIQQKISENELEIQRLRVREQELRNRPKHADYYTVEDVAPSSEQDPPYQGYQQMQ